MTDVADPKTLMDQAAPTVTDYLIEVESRLLETNRYTALREEEPAVYYRLVGDLVKAASADFAGTIVARAIELSGD